MADQGLGVCFQCVHGTKPTSARKILPICFVKFVHGKEPIHVADRNIQTQVLLCDRHLMNVNSQIGKLHLSTFLFLQMQHP
jgi:hypothetical protein